MKSLSGIKACLFIKLDGSQHGGRLPHTNHIADTSQHDHGIVGFGQKLNSTKLQAPFLLLLLIGCCHHHHRNCSQDRILLHFCKEGNAIHDRHHNVQKNNRNILVMRL